MLHELLETTADEDWLKPVETPFFGAVSRVRLFAHALYHTSILLLEPPSQLREDNEHCPR